MAWRLAGLALVALVLIGAWALRWDGRSAVDARLERAAPAGDSAWLEALRAARPAGDEARLEFVKAEEARLFAPALDEATRRTGAEVLLAHLDAIASPPSALRPAQGERGEGEPPGEPSALRSAQTARVYALACYHRALIRRDGLREPLAAVREYQRFLAAAEAPAAEDAGLARLVGIARRAQRELLDRHGAPLDPEALLAAALLPAPGPGLQLERALDEARARCAGDPAAHAAALEALVPEYADTPVAPRLDLARARLSARGDPARYPTARALYEELARRVGLGDEDGASAAGLAAPAGATPDAGGVPPAVADAVRALLPGEDPALLVPELRWARVRLAQLVRRRHVAWGAALVLLLLIAGSAAGYPGRRPTGAEARGAAAALVPWALFALVLALLYVGTAPLFAPPAQEAELLGAFTGVREHDNNTLEPRQLASGALFLCVPVLNAALLALGAGARARSGWWTVGLAALTAALTVAATLVFLYTNDATAYFYY